MKALMLSWILQPKVTTPALSNGTVRGLVVAVKLQLEPLGCGKGIDVVANLIAIGEPHVRAHGNDQHEGVELDARLHDDVGALHLGRRRAARRPES